MAEELVYLQLDDEVLPVENKTGYKVSFSDVDSTQTTEAGTKVRNVTRLSVPTISVGFDCDLEMLQMLRAKKNQQSINVKFFNPFDINQTTNHLMYMTGYAEQLLADTEDGGIWTVSFNLEDLKDV